MATGNTKADDQITDRLIVKFSDMADVWHEASSVQARNFAKRLGAGAKALRQTSEGSYVIALPYPMTLNQAREVGERIKRSDPRVAFAEPDVILRPLAMPLTLSQPGSIAKILAWDHTIGLTKAWAITSGSANVRIGVVDSGITQHHLLTRVSPGYDFVSQTGESGTSDTGRDDDAIDPGDYITSADMLGVLAGVPGCNVADSSWHGTAVAGVIAANRDDGLGVTGVIQQGTVVPLRASWKCGGYLSDIVDAVLWGAGVSIPGAPVNTNPVRVINISLGYSGACSQFESSAYELVYEAGVAIIAAAGNDGGDSAGVAPSNCPHVIAVAASDADGNLASYSSRGANVAIMAPGGTYSRLLPLLSDSGKTGPKSGTVAYGEGTSFAAPWVSGTVGLMLSVNPNLRRDGIWQILVYSGTPNLACSGTCGGGALNIEKAVKLAKDGLFYADSVFDFGAAISVTDRPSQIASFTNLSGIPIRVNSISVSGLSANHFEITRNTCSGNVIADRAACEVGIRLSTTVAGKKNAELLFSTDTPSGEIKVAVSADVQASTVVAPNQTPSVSSSGGGGCVMHVESGAVDLSFAILLLLGLVGVRGAMGRIWEDSHICSYGKPMMMGSILMGGDSNRLPSRRFSQPMP